MKADIASITTIPTASELKKLDDIFRSDVCMGKPKPNLCMTFYKNRSGKHNNVKVWMYVEYSTMRVHDLFCTDNNCKLKDDIYPTYTQIEEDKIVIVNDKDGIIMTEEEIVQEFGKSFKDGNSNVVEIENVGNYFDDDEKKLQKIQRDIEKDARLRQFAEIEDEDEINNKITEVANNLFVEDSQEEDGLVVNDDNEEEDSNNVVDVDDDDFEF